MWRVKRPFHFILLLLWNRPGLIIYSFMIKPEVMDFLKNLSNTTNRELFQSHIPFLRSSDQKHIFVRSTDSLIQRQTLFSSCQTPTTTSPLWLHTAGPCSHHCPLWTEASPWVTAARERLCTPLVMTLHAQNSVYSGGQMLMVCYWQLRFVLALPLQKALT